jgi:hypothetical protein
LSGSEFQRRESIVGVLNILGGVFSATGGSGGAAIGSGGASGGGLAAVGTLNIMNGSFSLSGGQDATAIGSGLARRGSTESEVQRSESIVGVWNILGGVFSATGGSGGAAIGSGGAFVGGMSTIGNLNIINGSFILVAGRDGIGIGSGFAHGVGCVSAVTSLRIVDGEYNIEGDSSGTGIGCGLGFGDGLSNIDRLEIQNGSFRIACATDRSGIGASGPGSFLVDLIILDGFFEIAGSDIGACIGTDNGAAITSISIKSGLYMLSGPLGIGATGNGIVDAISIGGNSGTVFLDCSSVSGRTCLKATSLYLGNSSINAVVAGERFLSFESVSAEESKLWIEYMKTSFREGITGIPSLHFPELAIPVDEQGIGKMKYSPLELSDESLTREGDFHYSAMTGLLVSLFAPGKYSVPYHPNGSDQEIHLCFNATHSTFEVLDGQEHFLSSVGKCLPTPSQMFPISTWCTPSHFFTLSDSRSPSRFFHHPDLYEPSRLFTSSVPGRQSQLLVRSNPYTLSQSFTPSVLHLVSELFIRSDHHALSQFLTPSVPGRQSQLLVRSNPYTLSQSFNRSVPYPVSE